MEFVANALDGCYSDGCMASSAARSHAPRSLPMVHSTDAPFPPLPFLVGGAMDTRLADVRPPLSMIYIDVSGTDRYTGWKPYNLDDLLYHVCPRLDLYCAGSEQHPITAA